MNGCYEWLNVIDKNAHHAYNTIMEKKKIAIRTAAVVLSAVALVVLTGLNSGCKSKKDIPQLGGDKNYNLLVITVEGLRADRLGCFGFDRIKTPNMDQLANRGVRFVNCRSSVPLTLPSLCTVFTGREPVSHGVRTHNGDVLNDSETTLAELFNANGFQTHAVISSIMLHSTFGLNQGFDDYDDSLHYKITANNEHKEINAAKTFSKFKRWLDAHNDTHKDEKFFSWVHFFDPHLPYDPPGDFAGIYSKDLYSGEVSNVDLYIGKIIKELEDKKLLDRTLIVLAGNYGEGFGEHNEFGHGIFCYDENLRVPLIFSNPALFKEKKHINRHVGLIDLMPTLLHLYGLETPGTVQGRSIAHWLVTEETPDIKEASPPLYFESLYAHEKMNWAPVQGAISLPYKYIAAPEPELYYLDADPKETNNQASSAPGRVDVLASELTERKIAENPKTGTPIDPKKGIGLLNKLRKVKELLDTPGSDPAPGFEAINNAEKEFPGVPCPLIHLFRHKLLVKINKPGEAEAVLKKGMTAFPGNQSLKLTLALFYFNGGRLDEAKELCLELLKTNPRSTDAAVLLREVYRKRGKVDREMIEFYQNRIKNYPFDALLQVEFAEIQSAMGKKDAVMSTIAHLMENEGLMNDKDYLDIKTRIGIMLLRMGEYDRTITLCSHIASLGHESPQVLNQMGKAYSGKGNFEKSEEAYKKALELDKNNDLTLSNLGTLYLQWFRLKKNKEFHAKAVEFYGRAVEKNPKLVPALNGLAVAFSFSGEPQKAVEYWKRALEIDPAFSNVYFNLGITYLGMKNKTQALKYFNLCKERLYNKLSPREQQQLDTLITEAKK